MSRQAFQVRNPIHYIPGAWAREAVYGDSVAAYRAFINPALFVGPKGAIVTVAAAGAAIDATQIPLKTPLSNAIPAQTVLRFGSKQFALTTAIAEKGVSTIEVEALPTALVEDDRATYAGTGPLFVPDGIVLGRTFAERDATPQVTFGPADENDDEIFILAFSLQDARTNPSVAFYRHGRQVSEDRLPGWAGFSPGLKSLIRKFYQCALAARETK